MRLKVGEIDYISVNYVRFVCRSFCFMTSYLTIAFFRCSTFHEVHTLEYNILSIAPLQLKHCSLYI
ncbi:MAG: hypothetical protein II276_03045, partial [Bacteroidales bacterium]|nr:hypothetical protein [Bacteroidales bacterium]